MDQDVPHRGNPRRFHEPRMAEDLFPVVLPSRKRGGHAQPPKQVEVLDGEAIKMFHGGVDIAEPRQGTEIVRITVSDPFIDILGDVRRPVLQRGYLVDYGTRPNMILSHADESVEAFVGPIRRVVTTSEQALVPGPRHDQRAGPNLREEIDERDASGGLIHLPSHSNRHAGRVRRAHPIVEGAADLDALVAPNDVLDFPEHVTIYDQRLNLSF